MSGAVLIQVYDTIFKGKPSTFLLILALLPTFVSISLMFFVRVYGTSSNGDKKHLNLLSAIALTIAAYLMILIVLQNHSDFPSLVRIITFTILLILLVSPLGIAFKAQRENTNTDKLALSQTPLLESATDVSKSEDMNIQQAMSTANFWLLFLAMITGMGSGMATINNISQVGESLGYTPSEKNSLVALLSIWNFLGRFGAGFVSDTLLHKRGWARPLLMVITLAGLSLGHVVVASGWNLYVGSIIVGICYGSQWSLMPTITSEIFGVGHMGTIYNTIGVASPVGSYIFSVRIIGYIYDTVAGEDNTCYGSHCFMLAFLIMACFALFGCVVALVLYFRTRRFYEHVVIKRLRLLS